MARPKIWQPHGTVERYRQGGCNDLIDGEAGTGDRCDGCKAAMREQNSQRNAGMHIDQPENVMSLEGRRRLNTVRAAAISRPGQSNSRPESSNMGECEVGPTELAVRAQLEQYRDEQPVLVELALNAAKLLDNEDARNTHVPASRQMQEIVKSLTAKRKTKSGGRLASVQAMVGRKSG